MNFYRKKWRKKKKLARTFPLRFSMGLSCLVKLGKWKVSPSCSGERLECMVTWQMWVFSGDGNGGGGGRPLFPQWSHHVYPQFLPGTHPNANANANANHHMSQHHHQHPLPAARHSNRQTPSSYYLPNHHSNHYNNHHPNNYNYHRHHHYHHHNNNNHHHPLQKHNEQPRNLYHRNSGVGLQGNFHCSKH